jgi:hypothetical protein
MTSLGLAEQLLSVEGWFAFVFCLAVYLWSTTSLGQRSFTHAWLFTSLKVLTPTADSVDSILKTFQVDNRKQSQQQQQQTLQSLTAEQRLAKLHFSVSTVKPGSMTVVAMYQRDATALWKTLESFVCCSGPGATDMRVGASTANLWRTVLLGGYRVLGARLDDQPTAYAALLNIYCACHSTLAALGTLVVVFTTWTSRTLQSLVLYNRLADGLGDLVDDCSWYTTSITFHALQQHSKRPASHSRTRGALYTLVTARGRSRTSDCRE